MAGALDPYYDYALLGTSLPLSILSAALAKAGHSVLHVDEAEHYGGPWASITLTELVRLASDLIRKDGHGRNSVGGILDASLTFPAYSALDKGKARQVDEASHTEVDVEAVDTDSNVPDQLRALNRHFAISLAPTLLPCSGPTIDVLVRSKVASYCTFRLLQETALCRQNEVSSGSSIAAATWPLRKVPSSKEDIFKDKSMNLIAKRKLMKLLQQASGQGEETELPALRPDQSFIDYLMSREGAALPADLAREVAYGVALCSKSSDTTQLAMQRIRRHISSIGKYGNSAYLVGQYGGAGEMAQCYSRASAVQGAVFVLGHRVSRLQRVEDKEPQRGSPIAEPNAEWHLSLDGIEGGTKVGCVVGDADLLDKVHQMESNEQTTLPSTGRQAVGVLLLDRGMMLRDPKVSRQEDDKDDASQQEADSRPPETALVVFPPEDQDGLTVWALQMGEGTFSCPKGTYLVYLTMAVCDEEEGSPSKSPPLDTAEDARAALSRAREQVLHLASFSQAELKIDPQEATASTADNRKSAGSHGSVVPLMESYFVRETVPAARSLAARHAVDDQLKQLVATSLLRVDSPLGNIATSLDDATMQAEDLYWLLTSGRTARHGGDTSQQQQQARAQSEAMRRRLWRRGYTVGRGLGGTLDEEDTLNTGSTANDADLGVASAAGVCDFFPVDEDSANTGDDDA